MSAFSNPRPVLLPQGWPEEDSEREALTRVLLAAGADIERLLDEPTSNPETFVRHAMRLPFLRYGQECPMVAFAPRNDDVNAVLNYRSTLLQAVDSLRDTIWLVYLSADIRYSFHQAVTRYGELFDAKGGLLTLYMSEGVVGLVSRDTWVVGLAARLDELLNTNMDSGVMPVDAPIGQIRFSKLTTTEPAPPDESAPLQQLPYAAVAGNAMPSHARSLSPSVFAVAPSSPSYRPISTMPPNPRLRKG